MNQHLVWFVTFAVRVVLWHRRKVLVNVCSLGSLLCCLFAMLNLFSLTSQAHSLLLLVSIPTPELSLPILAASHSMSLFSLLCFTASSKL